MSQSSETQSLASVRAANLCELEQQLASLQRDYAGMRHALDTAILAPLHDRDRLATYNEIRDKIDASMADFGATVFQSLVSCGGEAVATLFQQWSDDDANTDAQTSAENAHATPSDAGAGTSANGEARARPRFQTVNVADASARRPVALEELAVPQRAPMEEVLILGKQRIRNPRAATITPDDLATIRDSIGAKGMSPTPPTNEHRGYREHRWEHTLSDDARAHAKRWLADAPPLPAQVNDSDALDSYVDALRQMLDKNDVLAWTEYSQPVAHAVASYAVSYLRQLQQLARKLHNTAHEQDFDHFFKIILRFSKAYRPGMIEGMTLHSRPDVGDSWFETTTHRRQSLETLLRERSAQHYVNGSARHVANDEETASA